MSTHAQGSEQSVPNRFPKTLLTGIFGGDCDHALLVEQHPLVAAVEDRSPRECSRVQGSGMGRGSCASGRSVTGL